MSAKPLVTDPLVPIVAMESRPADAASAHAPIIFANVATAVGCGDGIGWVTLEAYRHMLQGDQPYVDSVVVAHLRLPLLAMRQLHDALRGCLEKLDLATAKLDGPTN
jgi:hypothetical protein